MDALKKRVDMPRRMLAVAVMILASLGRNNLNKRLTIGKQR